MHINFSIILPCFNESENIFELYNEILDLDVRDYFFEIIFVNNGSFDNTGKKIDEIIEKSSKIKDIRFILRKINLPTNLGYGGGIIEGLRKAKGDFIGWTHADLQTPLDDFCKLFFMIKGKEKIFAKGRRVNNRGFDSFITRMHEFCAQIILGEKLEEINAQPKIINKKDLIFFKNPPKNWTTLDTYFYYISTKNNFEIIELDVVFKSRLYGQSKWKNNFGVFLKHLYNNFFYLIKLKFKDEKNNSAE